MDRNTERCQVHLEELMPLIRERFAAGQPFSLLPNGISMLPMLRPGKDTVTLRAAVGRIKKYDLILFQRENGSYVLHRVVKTGNTFTCIGDNQFIPERGIQSNQIVAVVSSFSRGEREYAVTDLRYRLYCRLWHWSRFPRRCLRAVRFRLLRCIKKR